MKPILAYVICVRYVIHVRYVRYVIYVIYVEIYNLSWVIDDYFNITNCNILWIIDDYYIYINIDEYNYHGNTPNNVNMGA